MIGPELEQLVHDVAEAAAAAAVRRVLDALEERPITRPPLVDATQVARALGVSRDTVYEHAEALGVRRVGDGIRPRLRFDLDEALAAWTARQASAQSQTARSRLATGNKASRPRRGSGTSIDLLPIRGERRAA
jgi:DNA-binding transcriptional ArsR family regulator